MQAFSDLVKSRGLTPRGDFWSVWDRGGFEERKNAKRKLRDSNRKAKGEIISCGEGGACFAEKKRERPKKKARTDHRIFTTKKKGSRRGGRDLGAGGASVKKERPNFQSRVYKLARAPTRNN